MTVDEREIPVAEPDIDGRIDPLTGELTYIVNKRQSRPNLPDTGCPFCVGGLEAPEPYEVKWFPNRWPAFPDRRAEVVLYSPEHDATFWELGVEGARRVVDLWADRTQQLGSRDDIDYVLVFENRGPEVGATITHPHGQIYAFDHVPTLPRRELERGSQLWDGADTDDRMVTRIGDWKAWVPHAPANPYAIRIAALDGPSALPEVGDDGRDEFAAALVDVTERLDKLFDTRTPYMMWLHQRPTDGSDWEGSQLHAEIVSPWRKADLMRFVAAGELGSGEFFNTVSPRTAAANLRNALE